MKMLIADDDISTIDMIEAVYDWRELGIDQILRAYNGVVAKQIIQQEQPEIVLCDIDMPQCNGIEVLKWIYENDIQTEFIFLTCYSDFEYAREALRYKATDYLTKPFKPEVLRSVVYAAIQGVMKKKSQNLAFRAEGDRLRVTNSMLRALSEGDFGSDREELQAIFAGVDPNLDLSMPVRVVYVQADLEAGLSSGWEEDSLNYAFGHISMEAITGKLNYEHAFLYSMNQVTTMLVLVEEPMAEDVLRKKCEDLISLCRRHLSCNPMCLVGNSEPLFELQNTRTDMDAAMNKLRFRSGKVVFYNRIDWNDDPSFGTLDRDTVLDLLRRKDRSALLHLVEQKVNEISANVNADVNMHMLHQDLLQIYYGYIQDNNIQAHALFRESKAMEMNEQAESSANGMLRYAGYMFDCIEETIDKSCETSKIVEKVRLFIEQHYREDISRIDIASFAYITPNYLSKLFRNETGMTLREYINHRRIQEAKKLMSSTDMSISDIALEVGFYNIPYFSTVFKKACGVSPAIWRSGE